jgi:hypothetical protein
MGSPSVSFVQGLLETGAPLAERQVHQGLVAEREQVEADQLGGRLLGELADPRRRRVDPCGQVLPLEALLPGEPLRTTISASTDALVGQQPLDVGDDLGEVRREWSAAPTGQLDIVAVAHDHATEPVPLRLVDQSSGDAVGVRDLLDRLGEHGLDREFDGLLHVRQPTDGTYRPAPALERPRGQVW